MKVMTLVDEIGLSICLLAHFQWFQGQLPELTFLFWIHWRTNRTIEGRGKFFEIADRSYDTESRGSVRFGHECVVQGLFGLIFTPNLHSFRKV